MSLVVQISELSVSLGGREILSRVNAEIRAGEFVGIFGPNGAGKSTLLRCILGTLSPSSGSIRVLGLSPRQAATQIGYMPQGHSIMETTTLSGRSVIEAICHGTRWGLPWPSHKQQAEVDRVLRITDAMSYADRPLSVLSGGERQRIMLSQALLGHPKVLALDEPLASLDPKNQAQLVALAAQIKNKIQTTILFVGHDLNPLMHVMDRVLYIAGGKAMLGSVEEVVNSESLSRLYGFPINVIRAEGRIFVLSAEGNVMEQAHHD